MRTSRYEGPLEEKQLQMKLKNEKIKEKRKELNLEKRMKFFRQYAYLKRFAERILAAEVGAIFIWSFPEKQVKITKISEERIAFKSAPHKLCGLEITNITTDEGESI